MKKQIELKINGEKREILVAPNELLLNVLRERLGMNGPAERKRNQNDDLFHFLSPYRKQYLISCQDQ